jgi:hypothetical protein
MFETFRMLGQEHEADLAREAAKQALAAEARDPSAFRRRCVNAWALGAQLAGRHVQATAGSHRRERRPTTGSVDIENRLTPAPAEDVSSID